MKQHIIPRYKLILLYDIKPGVHETYYNFVMNEFVPSAQAMGLHILQVYHTLWGTCPLRQTEFVSEDLETILDVLESPRWQSLEDRLQQHADNYQRKVVLFRPGFQI